MSGLARSVRVLFVVGAFVATCPCAAEAGGLTPPSYTGTPVNSWAYSEVLNVGQGQSSTYYPTSYSDYAGAQFQGYVTYNDGSPPSFWTGVNNDAIEVFGTYLTASTNMTLALAEGGDDGHSIFIDHNFVGGAGFGPTVDYTLSLTAGETVLLEVVGYNGPGDWAFSIGLQGSGELLGDVAGLSLDAVGSVSVLVPEPSSLVLMGLAAIGFGLVWFSRGFARARDRERESGGWGRILYMGILT